MSLINNDIKNKIYFDHDNLPGIHVGDYSFLTNTDQRSINTDDTSYNKKISKTLKNMVLIILLRVLFGIIKYKNMKILNYLIWYGDPIVTDDDDLVNNTLGYNFIINQK